MTSIQETLTTVTGWLRQLTEFGIAIIIVMLIIDVLFPGSTGLTNNIGTIVASFSDKGLAGLIALLLFLFLFKNNKANS